MNNPRCISVSVPARLHLGFLDMHGGFGRKFGSLGLSISPIETVLSAERAADIEVSGPSAERGRRYAERILSHFGIEGGVKVSIHSAVPEHIGLGSGTRLSLSIAVAIARLYGLSEQNPVRLAVILHRGARSGVGIGTFMWGGFVIDGGRGERTEIPPIISRLPFPENWRMILILDDETEGINGAPEQHAFDTLAPMSESMSGLLSRLTLMQVLPAICENDCERFGMAITEIQNIMGDYFSPIQKQSYASAHLKSILDELTDTGATGVGQSSWGPTGFAIFADEKVASAALRKVRHTWRSRQALRFVVGRGCNTAARISASDIGAETQDENLKIKPLN